MFFEDEEDDNDEEEEWKTGRFSFHVSLE